MRWIPDISSIERGDYFQESTVIYDKDKKPIYTLFTDGKRTYSEYSEISDAIKNAIVSTEDKTFFENPGIDFKWLVRAGYNYISGKTSRIQWTSTLSQQLISYTLLSKERSMKRKIQEGYLSYQLNKNYSKEKILEMYLNTISYGSNANGVEEASKTYFWKSAKDVWPLGASILASLPKWPTYYSPYSHRDRLMWEIYAYPLDDPESKISLFAIENRKQYSKLYGEFKGYLSGITLDAHDTTVSICWIKKEYVRNPNFLPDENGCLDSTHDELLGFFWDIIIRQEVSASGVTTKYWVEYSVWRKDFVWLRMFEDQKIDGPTFKKIIYDGLEFEFKRYSENIRYPYFVMYIKEYLEWRYGNDIDISQWLKVYTTLDPKLQEKAEELVKKQVLINKAQYGATSAALVSMDNKQWSLLAMVGGPDYFDIENWGNNNMAIAKRQPGSSFKPFVYALAISKYPIWPESPVADTKTSFWPWTPDNYDKKFKWVMSLQNALAYSRNIPAVKMFYLAWKEESVIKFSRSLWFTTMKDDVWYGAPMAIWTAEVRPVDLMQAYSVFANLGIKKDLYAIEKIEDSDGNILEEHKNEEHEPIFSPAASYVLNTILSNAEARPEWMWRNAITISWGRKVAAKTWTSNKDVTEKNGEKKILPRDLWTAGYSPQITTVVWAGNVDGKETKWTCDWLNCAAWIWKPFMEYAHKDLPKAEWKRPEWVYEYTIAKTSWRLATDSTPENQKVSTIMAVKLTESDTGFKEERVDTLCNGPISENTPEWAIGTILIPNGNPIIDGYDPAWKSGFFNTIGWSWRSIEPCERPGWPGNINISIRTVAIWNWDNSGKKIVEWSWSGDRNIKEFQIIANDETKLKQALDNEWKPNGSWRISILLNEWLNIVTFKVIDIYGFTYTTSKSINNIWGSVSEEENLPWSDLPKPTEIIQTGSINTQVNPSITITNPKWGAVNLYSGDFVNLRFSINVIAWAREVSVSFNWKTIYTANSGNVFVVPINTTDLAPWKYPIRISVIDSSLNASEKAITVTILPR
jgi:penicillin-binding protein 1A